MAFFVQHSTMVRRRFRRFLAKFIPSEYHGSIYTIASAIVLIISTVFWQTSNNGVILLPSNNTVIPFAMHGIFILAMLGNNWATRSLKGSVDICGTRPLLRKIYNTSTNTKNPQEGQHTETKPLNLTKGPYRYVRHPNYFFCLAMIWSCPKLTLDRLLYNVLWTSYVIAGTILEERDLIVHFGEPYKEYQRSVPMLIPRFTSGHTEKEA